MNRYIARFIIILFSVGDLPAWTAEIPENPPPLREQNLPSGVLQETWKTDRNPSLRDFEDVVGWRQEPDSSKILPGMAFSEDTPGTAIHKLTAWVAAPVSGDVFFYISTRGAAKLVISQPDSIHPMASGGLLYIQDKIGWPGPGQWDLYPSQRLGPLPVIQGRKYLVEIWHGGKPGLKRCELAWSFCGGGTLTNLETDAESYPVRRFGNGRMERLSPEESEETSPDSPLFPAGFTRWFTSLDDGLAYQLPDPQPVHRLTFFQNIRLFAEDRQPMAGFHVSLRNAQDDIIAETTFEPEAPPLTGRFEWELPDHPKVARIVVTPAPGFRLHPGSPAPIPYQVEIWSPSSDTARSYPRSLIPADHLTASKMGPGDRDGNGLDDEWELDRRLKPSTPSLITAAGDDDGDGLLNQMESLAGKDPLRPDPLTHRLTAEYWFHLPLQDVLGLTGSDAFHLPPDLRVVRWMDRPSPLPPNSGLRIRGYFTARETGLHQFWIAARNSGELWISEDATKFRKYRIASLSPAEGSGHGISRLMENQWDQFAGQASRPIHMEAGRTYFLEALAQQGSANNTGQLNLAYSSPANPGIRRSLDSRTLQTWLPDHADKDDDYLPDDWEKVFGLDPANNGLTDRAREGERGDYDGDLLSNLLEYQLGTDPRNVDTDGDGRKDGEEHHSLGTSPLSAEDRTSTDLLAIDAAKFSSSSHTWHSLPDPGNGSSKLVAADFRGEITWSFSVTEPGYHGFRLGLSLSGQSLLTETLPLTVTVDEIRAARKPVSFTLNEITTWSVPGPWLEPGIHSLRLQVNNTLLRRSIAIHGITVFRPEGPDYDRDGAADWYTAALAEGYSLKRPEPISKVSPVCLEGTAPGQPEAVTLNGIPVQPLGDDQWFADVVLDPGSNTIELSIPGQPRRAIPVTWQTTNVLEDAVIHLRAGDSLLLAAYNRAGQSVFASCITQPGGLTGERFGVSHGTAWRFHDPGVTTIKSRAAGLSGTLTIHVASAVLPQEIMVVENSVRIVPIPEGSFTGNSVLEGSSGLTASREQNSLRLSPSASGKLGLTARLHQGGPILAASQIQSITLAGADQQEATTTSLPGAPAGYQLLRVPLFVDHLPEGATVEIRIVRAGILFADGSRNKILDAGNFQNGLAWLELFHPEGLSGGYCHTLTIRDRDGKVIGNS